MSRYLKEMKSGKLTVDKSEKLDGKYLLNTRDMSLSFEDVALGLIAAHGVEWVFEP